MARRLFAVMLGLLMFPSATLASRVLVLRPGGGASAEDNPYLPAADDTRPVSPRVPGAPAAARIAAAHTAAARIAATQKPKPKPKRPKPKPKPTVPTELARLARAGQIATQTRDADLAAWNRAVRALRSLHGSRAVELGAVMANLNEIAAAGQLSPSRLPELFLTLLRNQQWWTTGPLLSPAQRVQFPGSQIVWQYYPGQGIELQVLATFGTADGLYTAGPSHYTQMRDLIDEMLSLVSVRGGALTWEYLFHFDGGNPPWVSSMAQGTALEALTRAAAASQRQGDPDAATAYLLVGRRALGILEQPPPLGVAVQTQRGERFLQYSFAPATDIINAFLQTLIGLFDFASASDDPAAQALFQAGDAQAQAELPSFDTGAWSLYQPGVEDDLNYHQLVTGFLRQLCTRTDAQPYCTTASHFGVYAKTPPALSLLTGKVTGGRRATVRFALSKLSHVGIVISDGSRTVFLTSAYFSHGTHAFVISPISRPGSYTVRLAATDEAGNFNRIVRSLTVTPPRKPKHPRKTPAT